MFSPKRRFKIRRLAPPGGSISISNAFPSGVVSVANADGYFNLASGTPFTVEWFQYETSFTAAPRAFSIGNFPTATFAFSEEGNTTTRTLYLWTNSGSRNLGTTAHSTIANTWNHFAIVGNGSTMQVYRNGTAFGSTQSYTSMTSTTTLAIGNQTSTTINEGFSGYITNFRWVTGTAVYSNTFSRPSQPLTAIPGTILLLSAFDASTATIDSSPNARSTTTAGTISWVSNTPFA